jgi:cellobiose phosphorylase
MIIKNNPQLKELNGGGISFRFLETGDIFDISYQDNQINLVRGNGIDGSLSNLYLRVKTDQGYQFTRLIGKHSESYFTTEKDRAIWRGTFLEIKYAVILTMKEFQWDFEVLLDGYTHHQAEVFYGQDVAIQARSGVLSSEPYTVQYIDFKAIKGEKGYTLSAKQNQGRPQYLQIGSYTENVGYTTDGFQFFGLSYKTTGLPEALVYDEKLSSRIYQYEFSYLALQSAPIDLQGGIQKVKFYGFYYPHGYDATEHALDVLPIEKTKLFSMRNTQKKTTALLNPYLILNGQSFTLSDVKKHFSEIRHLETNQDEVYSFFTKNHHHVVMKEKELLVERQHGHLMVHGDLLHVTEHVMATTNFMFGMFSSHVVLGNTTFNKLTGDLRNPLNAQKISGTRIYVKINGIYQILGVPTYYEMGGATTRWYYQLSDDAIIVDSFVDIDQNRETLTFHSTGKKSYDVIFTHQILMRETEYGGDLELETHGSEIIIRTQPHSMAKEHYPDLKYKLTSQTSYALLDEKNAFGVEAQHGLLIMGYLDAKDIEISIEGTLKSEFEIIEKLSYTEADTKGTSFFENMTQNIKLTHPKHQHELDKLNDIAFWYAHNALVHYASPHGLEQYNGAAWGTRDVCQGPFEFFSANQRHDIAREILTKVYKRQFHENGDFPQWFMFDKYYRIQAHESHGDIIIWPLRSLAYYLKQTGDLSILDEQVPFMSLEINDFSESKSILEHVKRQILSIKRSFIEGTYLPRYGGGDWDDTLQPANHDLTNKMVSGWTVALLFEAISVFAEEIKAVEPTYAQELKTLADHIRHDYETHIMIDGIPAGFVVFEAEEKIVLLHPKDHKTGLKYRLLPFTRSMISEIAEPKKIHPYCDIINRYFKHPDGVRLMDTAVEYKSGKKTFFTRAETAANFGREIGLQYVHAHIRYIEAMAKIGHANEAWEGLLTVNPIMIRETVENAYYRQSNMYFSSSDAWFMDRYEAKKEFHRIRSGSISVKGGWRLYSSGPGIYLNQLFSNVLGIRLEHDDLVIDPILPKKLDGMTVNLRLKGVPTIIHYHYGKDQILFNDHPMPYKVIEQKYRHPAIIVDGLMVKASTEPVRLDVYFTDKER